MTLALFCLLGAAFAVFASGQGCVDDMDCDPLNMAEHPWRCEEDTSSKTICHLPGPDGKNGTCSCKDLSVEAACGAATPLPSGDKMKFLMIGDSLSIGQFPLVEKALASNFSSVHNHGNAASANLGSHCMKQFLGTSSAQWDVVSFQFGLHGLAHDIEWIDAPTYKALLTNLTQQLVASTNPSTPLLWTTTTPVPDAPVNPPRYNSDVVTRNAIAKEVVSSVVPSSRLHVLDLYQVVIDICGENYKSCKIQLPNNVHMTEQGWEILANHTVQAIQSIT